MKYLLGYLLSFVLVMAAILEWPVPVRAKSSQEVLAPLKRIPIQDSGRLKPLDTFARESLVLIYGREAYEGKSALEILMTWVLEPQAWDNKEFVEIRYDLVKKALQLDGAKRYFTLKQVLSNDRLSYVMQELQSKRDSKAKLDPYFQALQRLEGQIGVFRAIANGDLLHLVPPNSTETSPSASWWGPNRWTKEQMDAFQNINRIFVRYVASLPEDGSSSSKNKELSQSMKEAVDQFESLARKNNPEKYPDLDRMDVEIMYSSIHPFQKAWFFYLAAGVLILLVMTFKVSWFYAAAWISSVIGLLIHLFGFGIRIYLTGRPPVSNMYETVIWVAFGAIIFAMALEFMYRWRFILLIGNLVSTFCLILSDNALAILDPSLQPLEAVLNSQFWLTTHVLVITISYAAFFLAFALSDFGLYLHFKGVDEQEPKLRAVTLAVYRSMQIGVVFLAPGIILGGIWADYSWGRFWGWDPKETWALIALLGYLAVLHGRIAGWIRGFGLMVSGVLTFSLVVMAWYGVNYVLGAGLHSYGFGAGGVEYVAGFVGLHLVAVIFVSVLRMQRKKSH